MNIAKVIQAITMVGTWYNKADDDGYIDAGELFELVEKLMVLIGVNLKIKV